MSIAEAQVEAEIETFAEKDPWYSIALDLIKRKPLGAAGAFVVMLMILMAVFAELIAPYDPELNNYEFMLVGLDLSFLLGTDQFGRDIFPKGDGRFYVLPAYHSCFGGGLNFWNRNPECDNSYYNSIYTPMRKGGSFQRTCSKGNSLH